MAIVVTPKREYVAGDRLRLIVDITGDSSYPTGGSSLTLAMLGLFELDAFEPQMPPSGVRTYQYDYANLKLKAFSAFNTEVSNATDCSADVVRCIITGKGFPITGT